MIRIFHRLWLIVPPATGFALTITGLTGLLLAGCSSSGGNEQAAPAVSATPTGQVIPAPVVVAWVDGGDLFIWGGEDSGSSGPRLVASGGVAYPLIAPDGLQVAYLGGPDEDTLSLWIDDISGTAARPLVQAAALPARGEARRLAQVVWAADSAALYFNTQTGQGLATRAADDLWRVDAQTGTVERLLPDGEGGLIVPAPNGTRLALASAGRYAQSPAQIAFYIPQTRQRTVVLEFPALATASERGWYPALRWVPDGGGLYTAIPPPDLVYGAESATALWWLPVTGDPVPIGAVEADYFGLPVFSADGTRIAYIQRRATPDQAQITLIVAQRSGSDAVAYAQGKTGALTVPDWLPEGEQFLFWQGAPGQAWIGGPGVTASRFPADNIPVYEIIWADAALYIFVSGTADAFTLNMGRLESSSAPQVIATTAAYPRFDAVRP